jgi:hypothetical protein
LLIDMIENSDDKTNMALYLRNSYLARDARHLLKNELKKQRSKSMEKSLDNNLDGRSVKSKYMSVHKRKVNNLEPEEREGIMGNYLTMKNKNYIGQMKDEFDQLKQKKDDEVLIIQDRKRQLIYTKEEVTIMNMQNKELKKKIAALEKDSSIIKDNRTKLGF